MNALKVQNPHHKHIENIHLQIILLRKKYLYDCFVMATLATSVSIFMCTLNDRSSMNSSKPNQHSHCYDDFIMSETQ